MNLELISGAKHALESKYATYYHRVDDDNQERIFSVSDIMMQSIIGCSVVEVF